MTEQCCPTCGTKLQKQFSWSPTARIFTTPSSRVRLTKVQAAIFDVIWKAGKKPVLSQDRFMDAVYGDQLDGGPEHFGTLSIHLMRLRARIEPAGYTITKSTGRPRQGWRLVKLEGA